MTAKQFRRMKVFALRMVPTAIGGRHWQNVLREHVLEILSRLDCQDFSIHYSTITDWDNHEPVPGDDGTVGFALSNHPRLLCDFVSEYCWDNDLKREKEDRRGNCEAVETKTGIALACCLRAACDVAAAPSAGVLGWTVGDLRSMWPRSVPRWVKSWFMGDFDSLNPSDPIWL